MFRKTSPLEQPIAIATSPANTIENWQKIMEVCDIITNNGGEDEAIKLIVKRLQDKNPNVQRQAIKLLNSCCSNCGRSFKVALCSRDFCGEIRKLLSPKSKMGGGLHPTVANELKAALTEWSNSFAGDPQLSLISTTISEMKMSGVDFSSSSSSSSDTNNSSAQIEAAKKAAEEEDELNFAIAASLSLAETNTNTTSSTSNGGTPSRHGDLVQARSARCLYDFEATEDNELSFMAADVIIVTDHSDDNWWSGHDQHGRQGFFPASFVDFNLNIEIEDLNVKEEEAPPPIVIDEQKLDECLDLLYDCMADMSDEKLAAIDKFQSECEAMAPLIDRQVQAFDQASEELKELHTRFDNSQKLFEDLQTMRPMSGAGGMGMYGANPNVAPPKQISPMGMQQQQPPRQQQQQQQQRQPQQFMPPNGMPMVQGQTGQQRFQPTSQQQQQVSMILQQRQTDQQRPLHQGPSQMHAAPQNQIPTAGKPANINFANQMMRGPGPMKPMQPQQQHQQQQQPPHQPQQQQQQQQQQQHQPQSQQQQHQPQQQQLQQHQSTPPPGNGPPQQFVPPPFQQQQQQQQQQQFMSSPSQQQPMGQPPQQFQNATLPFNNQQQQQPPPQMLQQQQQALSSSFSLP